MIRNVIFDWSGTLINDLPAVWRATNHVLNKSGLPVLSLDAFRAEFQLPFDRFYQRCVGKASAEQLEAWFHEAFRKIEPTIGELPYARSFLEFCRAYGLRTYVLSTVHEEYYRAQASRCGFEGLIEHSYLGVRDKRERIGEVLETHGLQSGETVFIGDMEHDVETAHHGGVHSCAVLTGYNRLEQLRASGPELIVEHLGELEALLRRNDLEWPGSGKEATGHHPRVPIATVGALILDGEDRALLVRTHKWSDLWGIPGGKIQYAEGSEEALAREIKEETDLDIHDIRFVLVQDCITSEEFYREAHFVLLNYTARCSEAAEVRLNGEAQEHQWVPLADSLLLTLNRPTRVLIEAVLRDRETSGVAFPAGEAT